tara:strand:- start:1768 stop:2262 length:495 start_codon:yes stop_codon:yes gene_type:complete
MDLNELYMHHARRDELVEDIRDLKDAIWMWKQTLKENPLDVGYAKSLRKTYEKLLEQNRKYKGDIVPRKDRYTHKLYDEMEELTGDDILDEDRTYRGIMKDYLTFMEFAPSSQILEIMDHLPRARSELKAKMQLKQVWTKKIRDLHKKYNMPLRANPFEGRTKF